MSSFIEAYAEIKQGKLYAIKTRDGKYSIDRIYRYDDPHGVVTYEGKLAKFSSFEIDSNNWVEITHEVLFQQDFMKKEV